VIERIAAPRPHAIHQRVAVQLLDAVELLQNFETSGLAVRTANLVIRDFRLFYWIWHGTRTKPLW
jgi:hypothetical protein